MQCEAREGPEVAVAGAGSIGCYVGGCLAVAGRKVRLLARQSLVEAIAAHGLGVSDLSGFKTRIAGGELQAMDDPAAAMAMADVVLVTVKSRDTEEMARLLARHGRQDAVIVSLQNGVRNAEVLRLRLPQHRVIAGMVPFNVVQSLDAEGWLNVHRATSGTILVERGGGDLTAMLDVPHAEVAEHADMAAVQWGKLFLNLNNALNALSGLPLAEQLAMRPWRRLLADQLQEALACLKTARIRAIGTEGVPLGLVPHILRLPDALFFAIARRMLAIDPQARSSMWEDLERRRPTEIDYLQGEILKLADAHGIVVPFTRGITAAVKAAEHAGRGSPGLSPEAVRRAPKAA